MTGAGSRDQSRSWFRELAELERRRAELLMKAGAFPSLEVRGEGALDVDPAISSLIAQAATDFLSVHAADGCYLFASPACLRLFGWRPDEMVGRSAYDFFHPDDIDVIAAHHASHGGVEETPPVIYRLRRKDGSFAWVETHARAYRDDAGQDRIVSITHDVTERRALEEQKDRLIAELKDRVAQIQTLSGLIPICAWCNSVRDDQGFWDRVERYVSRMTDLEFTHSICPACAEKLRTDGL